MQMSSVVDVERWVVLCRERSVTAIGSEMILLTGTAATISYFTRLLLRCFFVTFFYLT
jgi:hypothetical protein